LKLRRVVIHDQTVRDGDFAGRVLDQFSSSNSRFENCRFDRMRIGSAGLGDGKRPSVYVNCTFDSAELDMGTGGVARFERCSFRDVEIEHWTCFAVELVECVFSGLLRRVIFNGTPLERQRAFLGRERNDFHGNDFSDARLIDAAFRTGIDLERQVLPTSPEYLYLPNAGATIDRALSSLNLDADRPAHADAVRLLRQFKRDVEDGQRQLFLRAADFHAVRSSPRAYIDRVFELLAKAAASG
jgi:hypothetical protein